MNNNDINFNWEKINEVIQSHTNFTEPKVNFDNYELPVNPTYELIEEQKEANKLLDRIVENTSVLKELVEINRETQLSTKELTYVMRAIYDISNAKNKKEADNLFKKAMDAINTSGESVENITRLASLLVNIYKTIELIGFQNI